MLEWRKMKNWRYNWIAPILFVIGVLGVILQIAFEGLEVKSLTRGLFGGLAVIAIFVSFVDLDGTDTPEWPIR